MDMKKYIIILLVATAVVGSSTLTVVGEPGNTSGNGTGDVIPLLTSDNTSGNGTDDIIPLLTSEHTGSTTTNEGNSLSNYFLPVIGVIGIIALLGCIFAIRIKKKKE